MELLQKYKHLAWDIVMVIAFAIISVCYFWTPVQDGMVLQGHDHNANDGIAKEMNDYREKHDGERTRWAENVFSGMPTYQISPSYPSTDNLSSIEQAYQLWLPTVAGYVFMMLLGFYILLRAFNFKAWMAALGAVLWAFSSYYFIIIAAGHIWKLLTLCFIPPTIAGVVLCYRGKYLWGAMVTGIFTALQVFSNHVQMSYYFLSVLGLMVLAFGIQTVRTKQYKAFGKATACAVIGGLLGIAVNLSNLFHTYQYSKETMRGKTELTSKVKNAEDQTEDGLERSYITAWSYGIGETWSLMIPNVKGGASNKGDQFMSMSKNENAMEYADQELAGIDLTGNGQNVYDLLPQYFGEQPGTSGPVYVGAFVMFLFVLSLFIVKGPLKWCMLAATVLSILLAWGKNFMPFTNFFLDNVPMYDKFRTVASILVIAEFTIPLMAMLALKRMVDDKDFFQNRTYGVKNNIWMYTSLALTGGVCLLFWVMPDVSQVGYAPQEGTIRLELLKDWLLSSFVVFPVALLLNVLIVRKFRSGVYPPYFWKIVRILVVVDLLAIICCIIPDCYIGNYISAANDSGMVLQLEQMGFPVDRLLDSLNDMRRAMVKADALRSFLVIAVGFFAVMVYRFRRINGMILTGCIAILCLVDMWGVNKRYLNDENFSHPIEAQTVVPTPADEIIQVDGEQGRVLNLSVSTFNDNSTSYFHQSIGGYHAAKLRRYQELIEGHIAPEISALRDSLPVTPVLNMLNTRYIIVNPNQAPMINSYACGRAWFVDEVKYVDNADAEFNGLKGLDTRHVAVADKQFRQTLGEASADTTAIVELVESESDRLKYKVNSRGGVLVFSEIYYPGWECKVDGKPVELGRVNYVLRAVRMEPGQHEVEMTFRPQSVKTTETIANTALFVLLLMFLGLVGWEVYKEVKRRKSALKDSAEDKQ